MSEKKNPLDAAINSLKQTQYAQYGLWPNEHTVDEYGTAIRVLEAAGKVDKAHCLDKLDFLRRMAGEDKFGFVRYSEDGLAIFPTAQIRALLESLPDEEQK